MNNIRVQDNLFNNLGFMANTKMDNYIDSLEKGDKIECDGEILIFDYISDGYIFTDTLIITINNFHEDLEFGENHLFNKFKHDEKIDEQTNAGVLQSKGE